jgi:hypothetical protein
MEEQTIVFTCTFHKPAHCREHIRACRELGLLCVRAVREKDDIRGLEAMLC